MATSPVTQSERQQNIATYAQPYVESMLGATMQNLFNVDPTTGQVLGLREYQPYSYRPEDYVAGFTPLQEQARQGIAALQVPGYATEGADAVRRAIARAEGTQYTPLSLSTPSVNASNVAAAQLGAAPTTQAALMQAYQLGAAPTISAEQFQGPGAVGFERVASQAITAPEMEAAQTTFRPTLEQFQMGPAERIGEPRSAAEQGALQAYMSPYMQNVVDVQQREAKRQAAIAQQALGAQAARSGMFGGSGSALQRAQANAQLQRDLQGLQATGLQSAFQNAQQQFNAEQQARMQAAIANQQAGMNVGAQNLAAKLGVQQLGTQTDLQTALANMNARQQAAVQNQATKLQAAGMNATQALQAAVANQQAGMQTGQFNAQQAFNTALQNAQLRQQAGMANQAMAGQFGLTQGQLGQAANLANQQAQNQAALANQSMAGQFGLQQGQLSQQANLANAQNALQASMANAQQQQAANALAAQQQQFGANLGLQSLAQSIAGAGMLGNLGTTQLQNQMNVLGAQNQFGAQEQAMNQRAIDQAVQNYNTAQQYPYMQLGVMQNMLGGLPISNTSQQDYSAAPSLSSQLLGAGTALLGANQMLGGGSILGGTGTQTGGSSAGSTLGQAGSIVNGLNNLASGGQKLINTVSDWFDFADGGLIENGPPPKKNRAPMGLQALAISKI